jgi:TatD DNase family protein
MLVDSHCHIDFPDYDGKMDDLRLAMQEHGVSHALCVSVNLPDWPRVMALAERYDNFFASVGVHPDHAEGESLGEDALLQRAAHPKVVAIGETGLDYFRLTGDLYWQRERFRTHIRAARRCGKPLIIHTRSAAEDTLRIMREEGAEQVGGVMHCFTESQEVAQASVEMGFMISFSGIVTFRNAEPLRQVAKWVPADSLLVETDAPYLAPVPMRGKVNQPAWVRHVAECVAQVRGVALPQLAAETSANFSRLFRVDLQPGSNSVPSL